MKLTLAEIGQGKQNVSRTLELSLLKDIFSGDLSSKFLVSSDHQIDCIVEIIGTDVVLIGDLKLHLSTDCSYCLKEFKIAVPVSFSMTLIPKQKVPIDIEDDLELKKEDLMECFYEGDSIDLGGIIREQIMLALPMYPRCSENCQGLCAGCGVDLNVEPCKCKKDDIDARWAGLKLMKQ